MVYKYTRTVATVWAAGRSDTNVPWSSTTLFIKWSFSNVICQKCILKTILSLLVPVLPLFYIAVAGGSTCLAEFVTSYDDEDMTLLNTVKSKKKKGGHKFVKVLGNSHIRKPDFFL